LTQILEYPIEVKLLYRATRDGFQGSNYHYKCRDISNTLTIVKTTSNSVFGGFNREHFRDNYFRYDQNSFIFALRRLGNQNRQRFYASDRIYAIDSGGMQGPSFGPDLTINDNSNERDSKSDLGFNYQLPNNIEYGTNKAKSYLAGSSSWKTTEIEVYEIKSFMPYSVTQLHNG
jgi:hypothetical protein